MAQHAPLNPYVAPIGTSGTALAMDADTGLSTLVLSTTYLYPLGNAEKFASEVRRAELEYVHVRWDASAILTITFETTGLTRPLGTTDYSTTAGEWVKEDPTTAYVAVTSGAATVSNMTVSVAGGNAGGATFHIGNFAAPRARLKIVVGGTGGVVGVAQHGKS